MATYFVEAEPDDGRLIRYGKGSKSDPPILADWNPYGRWSEEYQAIVTPDMNIREVDGTTGYCWEYIEGKVKPATIGIG